MGRRLQDCEFRILLNGYTMKKLAVSPQEWLNFFRMLAEDVSEEMWDANEKAKPCEGLDCWKIDLYNVITKESHTLEGVVWPRGFVTMCITNDPLSVPHPGSEDTIVVQYPDVMADAPSPNPFQTRFFHEGQHKFG